MHAQIVLRRPALFGLTDGAVHSKFGLSPGDPLSHHRPDRDRYCIAGTTNVELSSTTPEQLAQKVVIGVCVEASVIPIGGIVTVKQQTKRFKVACGTCSQPHSCHHCKFVIDAMEESDVIAPFVAPRFKADAPPKSHHKFMGDWNANDALLNDYEDVTFVRLDIQPKLLLPVRLQAT
jgi:hypothetical protein